MGMLIFLAIAVLTIPIRPIEVKEGVCSVKLGHEFRVMPILNENLRQPQVGLGELLLNAVQIQVAGSGGGNGEGGLWIWEVNPTFKR